VLVRGYMRRDVDVGFIRGIDPLMEAKVGKFREYLLRPEEAEVFCDYERCRDDVKRIKAYLAHHPNTPYREVLLDKVREYEETMRRLKPAYDKLSSRKPMTDDEIEQLFTFRESELPGVVIGVEMMKFYELHIGDTITLLTSTHLEAKAVRTQKFVVLGAFKTGVFETDRRFVYGLLDEVRDFIGVTGISGVSVKLDDYSQAQTVRAKIRDAVHSLMPGRQVYVRTWEELNKTLLQAVRMEKWLLGFIIFFIVVVAGFGIVAILTMMVSEKTHDIGIMKALGGTTAGIMGVFLIAGVTIAVVGSVLGLAGGLAFVYNINQIASLVEKVTGYHPFPRDVYYLDRIPTRVDAGELAGVIIPTLLVSFLFALYPALRAARLEAIEALRYE